MLFKTAKSNLITPNDVNYINELNINFSESCKILGVHLDQYLNYKSHIDKASLRLNSACYAIRVLSRHVNGEVLKTAYYGNVYPILKYGIVLWGSSDIQRIFVIQKKILRIMLKMNVRDTCRGRFKENSMLTVVAIYIYECLLFMSKNKHYFNTDKFSHVHNTRGRNTNLQIPKHRLALRERSPRYMIIKLFNVLPDNLKRIENVNPFKRALFELLMKLEPYSIHEFFTEIKTI